MKNTSQWDYELEGFYLAHCLGTKNYDDFAKAHVVYSLRDGLGYPHATILCVRPEEYSPYGACWDVGSRYEFAPEGESLRILQVRGRNDDLAMAPFHAIVRDWYILHGGQIDSRILSRIDEVIWREGDSDWNYHFRYLLDERNPFTWAHWNEKMRAIALWEGTSL